jgi:hypothetical protein
MIDDLGFLIAVALLWFAFLFVLAVFTKPSDACDKCGHSLLDHCEWSCCCLAHRAVGRCQCSGFSCHDERRSTG